MIKYVTLTDTGKARVAHDLTELMTVLYDVTQLPEYAAFSDVAFNEVQIHLCSRKEDSFANDSLTGEFYVFDEVSCGIQIELSPLLCFPVSTGKGYITLTQKQSNIIPKLREVFRNWSYRNEKTNVFAVYFEADNLGYTTNRQFIDMTTGAEANLNDWCVIIVGLYATLTPDMYNVVR